MTQDKVILLVGGYGHVGKLIASEIKRCSLGKVIIAGRDLNKARNVASEIDITFEYAMFDIQHFGIHEKSIVDNADSVVICVDQTNTAFAEYCLSRGKLYIDITASSDFLKKIESLNKEAIRHQSLAIVSVGLCPGLTNLVAARLKTVFPDADEITTGLLLALGERHGHASVEWTLDNYIEDFLYDKKSVRSFFDWYPFDFPKFTRKRKAYRFNFSDQHALHQSFPECHFKTFLCFDSVVVSTLLHVFKMIKVDRLLRLPLIKSALVYLFMSFSFGKEGFSGECVAINEGNSIGRIAFHGEHTGLVTALVAVATLTRVNNLNDVYGVKHIHEILQLTDITTDLSLKTSLVVDFAGENEAS